MATVEDWTPEDEARWQARRAHATTGSYRRPAEPRPAANASPGMKAVNALAGLFFAIAAVAAGVFILLWIAFT